MSSWNTNVLPFEPVYYCQPQTRHMQAPAGYSGYCPPTRDIVTSVCDVMSAFLKHPLSEAIIKPKSPSIVDLIPKIVENDKLMEHLHGAFNALRVAYEKHDPGCTAQTQQAQSTPSATDVSNSGDLRKFNLESYPQRLLLNFSCDWAEDGVAILHIDRVKPAILTITVNKPQTRVVDIEKVICCDMDVYVSHRIVNQRCFIYLDEVNEADLVDQMEVHMTILRDMTVTPCILRCISST